MSIPDRTPPSAATVGAALRHGDAAGDEPFSRTLQRATAQHQDALMAIPFVRSAVAGRLRRETYVAFLVQAYHHVRHTVPLLTATRDALGPRHRWLAQALDHYIEEETGHEEWIVSDVAACGGDADAVRHGEPDHPAEVMVAFAYDVIARRDPLGFLGMVHVLEGTSVRGATRAAEALQASLGLPPSAFTYLLTHGDLDHDHVAFFASLVDRVDGPSERRFILHCAERFYRLYGDVFRALPEE